VGYLIIVLPEMYH